MKPWEEYQQAPIPQLKPWEEYSAAKPRESGFSSRVGEDMRKRGAKLADIAAAKQTEVEDVLQAAGQEVGAAGDVIGQGISSAARTGYEMLPDSWQQGLGNAANYVADSAPGQFIGRGIDAYGQNLEAYNKANPRMGRNFEAVRNIGTAFMPIKGKSLAGVTKDVGMGTVRSAKAAGDKVAEIGIKEGKEIRNALIKPEIPSAETARNAARASYKEATKLGGSLKPEFSEQFVGNIEKLKKQTKWGAATSGDNAITSLVERYKDLKNEPITLEAAQEIDEGLSELIDGFYDNKGRINKEGLKVQKAQQEFRRMIEETPEDAIVGGKAGFDAWKKGQKEWSAATRLADIERILTRAEAMDNPATSIKAGFRMLERTGMRGYSEAEKEAIRKAARSGIIGGALRTVLGSRLIGTAVGASMGLAGGPLGAAVGGAAGAAQSALSRKAAEAIQMGRANEVRRRIAGRLPKDIGKLPPKEAKRILEAE